MTGSGPRNQLVSDLLDLLRSAGGLRLDYVIEQIEPAPGDPAPDPPPTLEVVLSGPDTPLLLDRNGELLHAIESLAASILRLTPEQGEQLSFDAAGFKAERAEAVAAMAASAIESVRTTGRPFVFAPMNSRERRMLHLALAPSGLSTASSGLGGRRFVVLYPAGQTPEPERFAPPARPSGSPPRNRGNTQRNPPVRFDRSAPPLRPTLPYSKPYVPLPFRPDPFSPETIEDKEPGNIKADTQSPAGVEDEAATAARLESIRRAFRKR